MNKTHTSAILAGIALFATSFGTSCASQPNAAVNAPATNTTVAVPKTNDSAIVSSHSTAAKNTPTNSATSKPQSSGNSPMAKTIDTGEMTANIEKAEKAYKAKSGDAKLKDALAETYFVRAFALTEAAQYRAALGDFRKGLKLKPDAEEAKKMHDEIISIFKSINREPPKEGEEPAPMPFSKQS